MRAATPLVDGFKVSRLLMATKVIMPQMGESILEGTITKWLKQIGDAVARDEPLFEISTDKVDSEIPSPAEGILSEILVPEGETVQIDTVVAVIDGSDAAAGSSAPSSTAAREETSVTSEPDIVAPEPVASQNPIEPPDLMEKAPVGEARPPSWSETKPRADATEIRTSPLVRRLARENNIDLSEVPGTGSGGRITKQDLLRYIETSSPIESPTEAQAAPVAAVPAARPPSAVAKPASPPQTIFSADTPLERVPMSAMRRAIAEHMTRSRQTSAHVSTLFEVDMTSIVDLREGHKEVFERTEGVKLTYTPFIGKALVDSVREFPIVNSSVSGDEVVYHRGVHLGIAVALAGGLIVPVVKDAHLKSFTGLALSIADLAERARTKKLKPEEVQNGTVTITNPGPFGALFGTPIINQPQVAIMGVGSIEKRPVVMDNAIAIRSMVYLSLSFDHRVIDGAVADQFMAAVKGRLQAWTDWVA